MNRYINHIFLLGAICICNLLSAQQIILDKPLAAGELTLFQDLSDENVYYYLPDKARLATDENGNPKFSFLRYVDNVRGEESRREGEGGGIVHAVVRLGVTEDQLDDAKRELSRQKPGARIEGPIVYRSGKFGLISSFADAEGNLTEQLVGLGVAPIMDNQEAAISMQLSKLGAKILWESFQTATPDISFSFEMEMSGYRMPHRAVIEANFDQIYQHESFGAGVASTFLAGEIKKSYDDLYKSGAIKLTQIGEDEELEGMITTAYNKLADMMFAPLGGSGSPNLGDLTKSANGGNSLLDKATKLLQDNRQEARDINTENRNFNKSLANGPNTQSTGNQPTQQPKKAKKGRTPLWAQANGVIPAKHTAPIPAYLKPKKDIDLPNFAVLATYEMKEIRQTGIFRIDLNKYTTDNLSLRFDENIGNLNRYLNNERYFRQINLDDPLYRQREVIAFLDGLNATDFGKFVNYVDVRLEKKHENGDVTYDEVRIDRNNFNKSGNNFKLVYGWKGDNNRDKWMDYNYSLVWGLFGGTKVELANQASAYGTINLTPPYQRRLIDLHADPDNLKKKKIRSIIVKMYYEMEGREMMKQTILQVSSGKLSDQVELLLPPNQQEYSAEIIWRREGNKMERTGRFSTSETLLFVDELPKKRIGKKGGILDKVLNR